jgi:hypothetical protein
MVEDLYAKYQNGNNFWDHALVLRHEIGHNLTLHHVWLNDYCNDINGHTGSFKPPSVDNNVMGYNGAQNSMTIDQVTRCHHFLHNNQWVLSSGQNLGIMSGTISQSRNNGSMSTVNNVNSTGASVTIQSQSGTTLNWVKQSGSGSFSSSNNGHTLSISNLGSISLMATWEENCLNYSSTVAFYNQPSWRMNFDQEEGLMSLVFGADNPLEQINLEPFDYKIEVIDQSGNIQLTSIIPVEDFTVHRTLATAPLESGTYIVKVWINELVSAKQILIE